MTDMEIDIKAVLGRIALGQCLSEAEAEATFNLLMSGDVTPSQMGGLLMGMRVRGETVDEIAGAARAMRAKALSVSAPPGAIDTCGTGGSSKDTHNVSTAAAFVVAGCGVTVAKHGNVARSSKSGSADVLARLGVNLEPDLAKFETCLNDAGIAFMFAQRHHGAMRNVGPTRVELGTATIFNLLGPLANPAGIKRQLMGVYAARWVRPIAEVLARLGSERAWVVHGSDGMDELTTTGPSLVAAVENGETKEFEVDPQALGLARASEADLIGGEAEGNAAAIRQLLDGAAGPLRDIVTLNAGAALVVAGMARELAEGIAMAGKSIDDGRASKSLERLVALTNGRGN